MSSGGRPAPYLRLSTFYLFYFATIGALLPYWSLYLRHQGLSPAAIGTLVALTLATKMVAPYLWGWIADRGARRMPIVRLACVGALVGFSGVYPAGSSLALLALVMLAFSFFWNAALPQFEATTLNHLDAEPHRYASVRLWGSVGFIATVTALGPVLEVVGVVRLPDVLVGLFLGLALVSFSVPECRSAHPVTDQEGLGRVLRRLPVITLLAICFLNQASHGPYYGFFSILLRDLGYREGLIGLLWALGVVAEVVMFLAVPRLLPRFGTRRLMLLTLALTAVRWLLVGWAAQWLPALLLAQLLHAFSFGLYHVVAIHLVHHYFRGAHQGRGQALYSSLSFGAGGALGSFSAGQVWVGLGPGCTFSAAALLSLLGLLVAWRGMER